MTMDFAIRSKLIAEAKIGTVSFVAASVSGAGKRRLQGGAAIGVDGEEFEDLGENARTEQIEATVDETTYLELEGIRRDAKRVTCQHPLFGVFEGRISDLSYKANERQGVDISVTLIEDGDHSRVMAPVQVSFPQASGAATASLDAFSEGLDEIPSDVGGDLLGEVAACGSLISTFETALSSAALGGIAAVQDLAGAFGELSVGVDSLISSFDLAAESVASLADSDLVDLALSAVNATRQAVEALSNESTLVWQPLPVAGPLGLDAVAYDRAMELGIDPDDALAQILSANTDLVDLVAIPTGFTLWLPV
jgi:hypothetical protein